MSNKMTKPLMHQFEDALCALVETYMRDGLSPANVQLVLRTRAEDDYTEFACGCPACIGGVTHASSCAVHNAPALPVGPCDCGAAKVESR